MTRRVLLLPFVLLLVLVGVVVPAPAMADDHAPVLTSVRLAQPVALGRPVFTDVQGSDTPETGSGISLVELDWARLAADGRQLATMRTYTSGVGDALGSDGLLGPWTAAGHWSLQRAAVGDRAGNVTTYHRDGTVSVSPSAAAPPAIDLSPADFDVTNANQDIAAPVVDAGAPLNPTVQAGQPLAVLARLRDDRSQVDSLYIEYESASGDHFQLSSGQFLGASGLAAGVVPLGVEGGTWHATSIDIADFAGNRLSVSSDGSTHTYPEGISAFTTPPALDWSQLDVTVETQGPADTEPPVLQSATLVTPSTVRTGDSVEIAFDATDATAVSSVGFRFTDAGGHGVDVDGPCPSRGTAIIALPPGLDEGPLTIQDFSAVDTLGHNITYFPDGTTRDDQGVTGQHNLDLHALDMTLVAGQGAVTVPRSTTGCRPFAAVTTTAPSSARRGTAVPVTGTVTVAGQPVADGVVAVYRTDLGTHARFVQLLRTDGYGRYVASLPLTAPTTVRVEFLGRSGALPALGPNRVIRWARGLSLSGTATASSTAVFTTRVVPCVAGSRILLQYLKPGGSDTVAIATTDAQGYARFRIAVPIGQRTYRAAAQLTPMWAIATSPRLTQRRTQ